MNNNTNNENNRLKIRSLINFRNKLGNRVRVRVIKKNIQTGTPKVCIVGILQRNLLHRVKAILKGMLYFV